MLFYFFISVCEWRSVVGQPRSSLALADEPPTNAISAHSAREKLDLHVKADLRDVKSCFFAALGHVTIVLYLNSHSKTCHSSVSHRRAHDGQLTGARMAVFYVRVAVSPNTDGVKLWSAHAVFTLNVAWANT